MTSSVASLQDLPADVVMEVREASERIRVRMQRTAADIVEIGRDLTVIKKKVGHGNFLPWIDREFGMSEYTARRFMNAADGFKSGTVPDFQPTVIYALTSPSTPEEVRENVVAMAERGEKVTTKTVADLKEKLKQANAALKEEKQSRSMIEARSREVMAERDQARQHGLMLESQVRQLSEREHEPEAPAGSEVLPPEEPVDVDLHALLAIWKQAASETRKAFLAEIGARG